MFTKNFSKLFFISLLILLALFSFIKGANAQMMGPGWGFGSGQASKSDIQNEQKEEDQGAEIFQKLQKGELTCPQLKDDDFDKLGDYFMGKALGSTENHFYMDQRMTQMGESGNTQMHIIIGKRASGCFPNQSIPSNTPSYLMPMMHGGGGFDMMWGYGAGANTWVGFGVLSLITWVVVLINLVLLGVWLWKQITRK